ncbi:MAG: serine/threonine protein kinase [Moorea sp. SIO2B7]|nr:serine/threonine protein kinase [Moorena sp. SIO2B7]
MTWRSGHRLQKGKYIIERKLGEGGFGVTYKARHVMFDEDVVIKTPNDTLQNDPDYSKFVARFIKEGQTLAKLGKIRHPHIVRVTDLFTEYLDQSHKLELPCLVMDFIEGESLFNLVKRKGALPEAEAIKYIQQIGSALQIIHNQGLVHRDTHPGNIIIPSNQQAILIDFGIVGDIFPTTMSSKVMGNPAFAPNEQFRGGRAPTIDIYTLAASLYYAVTASIPQWDQNTNELILPKQLNSNLSDTVNRAISQSMAIQPKNRPQTIPDF